MKLTDQGMGLLIGIYIESSMLCWLIMAFLDMRVILLASTVAVLMVLLVMICRKIYGSWFFSLAYLFGIVMMMVGMFSAEYSWWRSIICAILMPLGLPTIGQAYRWSILREAEEKRKRVWKETGENG